MDLYKAFDLNPTYETVEEWSRKVENSDLTGRKRNILDYIRVEEEEVIRTQIGETVPGGKEKVEDDLDDLIDETDFLYERQIFAFEDLAKVHGTVYGLNVSDAIDNWYMD